MSANVILTSPRGVPYIAYGTLIPPCPGGVAYQTAPGSSQGIMVGQSLQTTYSVPIAALATATNTSPIVITGPSAPTIPSGITITGAIGNTGANGTWGAIAGGSITSMTAASPIVVGTVQPHGLASGMQATISGGITGSAGTWTVVVVDAVTFSLTGSSGSGTYSTGASWALSTPGSYLLLGSSGTGVYLGGGVISVTARATTASQDSLVTL